MNQHRNVGGRGGDPGDDRALSLGQTGRRGRGEARERVARPRHVGVARQPLLHQAVEPGPGQPEAVHEVADRRRAAQRLERLVAHAPLGRAPERPLALEQRGKRLRQHEHPFRLLRRPRRTLHAPQRPGEQRPQRQAEGRTVI